MCDAGEDTVFSSNITHNLNTMADAAGIYDACWRPEELGIKEASELIEPLSSGLALLKAHPSKFKEFNSPNGWGTYSDFVPWVEEYLAACKKYPKAQVEACR